MRLAVFLVALTAVASTAHAQAPGDTPPQPPQPPVYQPLPPPDAPVEDPIRAHRVRLGLAWGLTVLGNSHDDAMVFGGGGMVLGIRVASHVELTGEFAGGGGSDDSISRSTSFAVGLVGVRYHVNPASPASIFLDADVGFGVAQWDGISGGSGPRLAGALGAGIERRWARFSLFAEARWLAMSHGEVVYDEFGYPGDTSQHPNDPSAARSGIQIFAGVSAFL